MITLSRLVEVLTDLDLLHDGSVPEIRSWIERVTCDLAPGFIDPVRQWLMALVKIAGIRWAVEESFQAAKG